MTDKCESKELAPWRCLLHEIIFEADTKAGKIFDVALIISIVLSVIAVILDSVDYYEVNYGRELRIVEWFFTILFTIEYILRLLSVRRPLSYASSFFGIVDFLSIVPTYLSFLVTGAKVFLVVRILRLLRLFRVLKMIRYVSEASILSIALKTSQPKIIVFLLTVFTIVVIAGALMHLIEGPASGFDNIPVSMYWVVVTLTTVGYGDIAPQTTFGRIIASFLMIVGYGIIAVPTGIVSVELVKATRASVTTRACDACGREGHEPDVPYCKFCGHKMEEFKAEEYFH